MADRTVTVSLIARFQSFKQGIGDATKFTRQFREELCQTAKSHSSSMAGIERGAALAGVAMLGLAGWAVKVGLEFDRQMSAVSAVTNASAADLGRLRVAALAAGKDTVFSATEAAKAEEELAKAGISTADIMGGALSGALSLAAAGSLDLAEAADVSAKAMNIWKLRGTDVGHIADVLAAGANKSATDVHELGMALRMGGLAAKTAGLSLEDTVGTLSAFADRALTGSDAGTSLKTMFMMLSNPTAKAADKMKELGLHLYDVKGNFVGVEELAGQLQSRLGGLTQQQRQAALATIFGSDATRAATVLYEQGADGIAKYIAAVDDQGAASRAAAEKTNNLAGDIERLKGSLETLAITGQSGATGGLRMIVQALDSMVSGFSDLPGPVQTAIVVLAGVSGASLLAGAGLLKVKRTVGDLLSALEGMGPPGTRAAGVLGKIGSVAGKLGLAGIAAFAVFEGANALGDWFTKNSKPVSRDVDAMAESLSRFARSGVASGEMAKTFGADLSGVRRDMHALAAQAQALAGQSQMINGIRLSGGNTGGRGGANSAAAAAAGEINHAAAQAKVNLAALDASLAKLATNGGADIARMAMDRLTATTGLGSAAMTQYTAAMAAAAGANTGLAHGFGDAEANATTLGQSLEELIAKGGTLETVWNQLNGAMVNSDQKLLAVKDSLHNLKDEWDKHGNSLDRNTLAGLKNRVALEGIASGAVQAAEALRIQEDAQGKGSQATADAEKLLGQLKKQFVANAIAAGGDAEKVQTLADKLFRLPKHVDPKVNMTGASAAITQADALRIALDRIPNFVSTTITTTHVDSRRAAGGPVLAGVPYMINERGRETVTFPAGGEVHPAHLTPAYVGGGGAGGGGPVNITVKLVDSAGRTTRQALIADALGRGVPESVARAAYP